MADVDIVVESGDLKAAIDLLNDYGLSFTQMVNKVQTEGNRLNRASKATTDQLTQAWKNAENAITNRRNEEVARQEQATLKRREQNWRQFFQQDYMKGGSAGINASNSALLQQLETQAKEEKRILDLRQQSWRQFFQQDFMKGPSAGSGGAPTSAAGSALLQNEKALADAIVETSRASKEKAREATYLTGKYAPLLAAEQTYLRMQQEINRSTQLGILDTKQQAAALDQLEKEYQALNRGVYLAGSRFNQFGEMSNLAGRGAQKFGMYAQQAGYQIGDFAVQLQSGANAGVAFSQQAAQLAGLIPGLAGALTTFAAIGAGLGIQALIAFNEEGRKGKDIYEDLGSTLDKLDKLTFDNLTGSLLTSATKIKEEFQATFDLIERVETRALKANLDQPIKAFERQLSRNQTSSGLRNQMGMGDANFDYMGYKDVERAAQAFELLKGIQGETREELAASLELQTRYLQGSGLLTVEMQAQLATMAEELGIVDLVVTKVEEMVAAEEKVTEARKAGTVEGAKLLDTLLEEQYLREVSNKHGEESLELQKAIVELEHIKTLALIDSLDISEDLRAELEVAADATFTAENATLNWAAAMAQVNAQLTGAIGLLNSISGGRIQAAGINAAREVLAAGGKAVDAERARRRKIEDMTLYETQDRLMAEGKSSEGILAMERAQLERNRADEDSYNTQLEAAREAEREAAKAANKKPKKGAKEKKSDAEKEAEKQQEKLKDFFTEYNKNIEQQERLLGIQGEQREELEKIIEVENRLGVARGLVSEEQIAAMAREELALERKLQREQEIYNMGSQAVEDLLMTVVNGTGSIEEAFKGMLASIISDIYQQYVAKGAADMAGNFLLSMFSANGNAFGAGGVKMFANGGVVGSPTLFGYGGGKTGMMGEAGPEAIMPLKRNSQGKLGVEMSGGGSGDVRITQVFQMQASGDQAVKAIIQQQMPAIANAAKQAVVDAKRRNQKGF